MIQLQQLTVTYPGASQAALLPTSLTFQPGELVGLLGASGAGKSTLLRAINMLVRPTAGQLVVNNQLIHSGCSLQQHRRNSAMIFQQHQLLLQQSALKNVLLGRLGYYSSLRSLLPMSKGDKEFALYCLERVGLLDKALERTDRLSGGQQQRVGIARALAQQPKVILADEPVASLDPVSSEQVLGLLRDICKEDGITAIVSLHQLVLAKQFAERIVALSAGEVVLDGPLNELNETQLATIYPQGCVTRAHGVES
ncbi:MAG: phosphonate ABC transporter ATP-binding protein [Gammaproteobacteria bacterium]|nr:phosphonate ABC transporter ATP-binding protein [Gammaproteobacteria bacterium]